MHQQGMSRVCSRLWPHSRARVAGCAAHGHARAGRAAAGRADAHAVHRTMRHHACIGTYAMHAFPTPALRTTVLEGRRQGGTLTQRFCFPKSALTRLLNGIVTPVRQSSSVCFMAGRLAIDSDGRAWRRVACVGRCAGDRSRQPRRTRHACTRRMVDGVRGRSGRNNIIHHCHVRTRALTRGRMASMCKRY